MKIAPALPLLGCLLFACGDAATSSAPSGSAPPRASSAPAVSAAAAPAKGSKAHFDAQYRAIFQQGSIDVPMPKKIETFVAAVGPAKSSEGGTLRWYARDATDCFAIELDQGGMMSASKLYENQEAQKKIIEAECPKP